MSIGNLLPLFEGPGAAPGMSDVLQTVENQIWFGDRLQVRSESVLIDGSSRDVGNTDNTTFLRPGLLCGTVTATGKLKQFNPYATDGTAKITHVLTRFLGAQRAGVNSDLYYYAIAAANLKTSGLIIPGESTPGLDGKNLQALVEDQLLAVGFGLDAKVPTKAEVVYHNLANATGLTLTAADRNKLHVLLTNDGAGTVVTLPAPKIGAEFRFYAAGDFSTNTVSVALGTNKGVGGTIDSITLDAVNERCTLYGVESNLSATAPLYAVLDNTGTLVTS
jgi:hypothetical protein